MDPNTLSSGLRLLLVEPAMGFGPARLVMAPVGVAGARLPAGVHPVVAIAAPAPSTGARFDPGFPTSSASSSRRAPYLVAGALPRRGRGPGFLGAGNAALDSAIAAAVANAGSSSTTGRRSVVAIGAVPTSDIYPNDDDARPADRSDGELRSKRDIKAWVELARLRTTFEVAFDARVLESGRHLRLVLDAIGDIDIAALSRPWSKELCLHRISAIIGTEKLEKLYKATPKDDKHFGWSAVAAQIAIDAIETLMAKLHGLLHQHQVPDSPLCPSCPMFLKQLLKVLCEFSTILESTKFRRPQTCIRYPMLEAHALALEHLCAICLDLHEETCQEEPEEKWIELRQQLMHRRITLFEQDMGIKDYLVSIGVKDIVRVIDLVVKVAAEVSKRASTGTS